MPDLAQDAWFCPWGLQAKGSGTSSYQKSHGLPGDLCMLTSGVPKAASQHPLTLQSLVPLPNLLEAGSVFIVNLDLCNTAALPSAWDLRPPGKGCPDPQVRDVQAEPPDAPASH